ncbi:hypothetical protein GNI_064040 [Gregarina niphandrodes]|uniref:Uncharacterized protein n=1 Tax=Gregarina niphandrodes TaxID=110365 RepID=A0A023B854_GRENI|nr:hypothetical protein GNI_064040 [Gregarina niphandrodes]EZG68184.1 hypothetical protein GNI_064040 [Gregarina niphandrodes]|eukprot:XP_011130078.1 hypothetical protein GNI_064040 [Gregarina niphandrodes]
MARCITSSKSARIPISMLLAETVAVDSGLEYDDAPMETSCILDEVADEEQATPEANPLMVVASAVDDQHAAAEQEQNGHKDHDHKGHGLHDLVKLITDHPALLFAAEIGAELVVHLIAHFIAEGIMHLCKRKKRRDEDDDEDDE